MMGSSLPRSRPTSLPFILVKWLAYLAVLFALWLAFNYDTLRDYFSSQTLMRQNQAEVAALESEHKRLNEENKQLEVGGFEAEKVIRERFKMVRPGERVIFIEEPKEEPKADARSAKSLPPEIDKKLTNEPGVKEAEKH
jgi:cell division protein FtsB